MANITKCPDCGVTECICPSAAAVAELELALDEKDVSYRAALGRAMRVSLQTGDRLVPANRVVTWMECIRCGGTIYRPPRDGGPLIDMADRCSCLVLASDLVEENELK